jgi:hypothetical protein
MEKVDADIVIPTLQSLIIETSADVDYLIMEMMVQ